MVIHNLSIQEAIMRISKQWRVSFASLAILMALTHECYGQDLRIDPLNKPISLNLTKATLMYAVGTLAIDQNIAVGLEMSNSAQDEITIDITVKEVALKDVLNLIAQQARGYTWEFRDGVVNFFPTERRVPFFERLLATRIDAFKAPVGNNKSQIRAIIYDLPEIKRLTDQQGVEGDRIGYYHRPSIYANNVDLSTGKTDLRSLLNKIVRESEHNIWVLQWVDKEHKIFNIGL
jgi:hypothetical protein